MSVKAASYSAQVMSREPISEHLIRLRLGGPELTAFASTGIADEWVGLIVPGQFQSRYYTVRAWDGVELTLDVVVHAHGLVTEFAKRSDCVGAEVTVTAPKGSFLPAPQAEWLILVGDLTAMPAMARIAETTTLPVRVFAEVPDDLTGYLPDNVDVTWLPRPEPDASGLAEAVEAIDWPSGPGYFWMAGESAQMRAVRKHLMRVRRLDAGSYDVMGYWRASAGRQPRALDPAPFYAAGKAAGHTDEQIWADYDAAREAQESTHD